MPSISNLKTLTTASGATIFPVVDVDENPDVTKKATFSQLKTYIESSLAVVSVNGQTGTVVLTAGDISGFAAVAISGNYADLTGTPTIPTATNVTLGLVKVGTGISVALDGTISTNPLVTATNSVLGGVKVGSGVQVAGDGTISVNTGTPYVLPPATPLVLGGVKIGSGFDITVDGTISVVTTTFVILEPFLAINLGEQSSYSTGTGFTATYHKSGIFISRGPNVDNGAYLYLDDDLGINSPTTSTRGIFSVKVAGKQSGWVTDYLRVSTGTSELNVFGYDNPTSVISVSGTTNYETQVTDDDHIPNKKYVDDKVVASTGSVVSIVTSTHASVSRYGSVKVGSGIDVTDGVISTSPMVTATNTILGGVKIGAGIGVTVDGTISVTTASFALQTATNTILGGVKIGSGVNIVADGTISVTPYTLPAATTSTLGGVKQGTNITIAVDGTISSAAAFSGGTVANSTQFTDTTASTSTTTGAVTIAGGLGVRGSINVANTVTAGTFASNTTGTPEVYSASNLNLTAVGRVQVTQSPFKVWTISSATRATITASNGDLIYNTDNNKFQGYANGTWVDLH